jgi:putative solute:sodium symporter small subunit
VCAASAGPAIAEPFPDPREANPTMTEPPSGGAVPDRPSVTDPEQVARHAEYWRRNIRYVGVLLAIWFGVSYGFGILLAEPLNAIRLPGTSFPLGFWFAQQGAIYVFVVLIFVYVRLMNSLDREFAVDEGGDR